VNDVKPKFMNQTKIDKSLTDKPQIVSKMLEADHFSKWMGMEIIDVKPNYCKISMRVRSDMLNGFGIAHGGVVFAMADSAFAFACNNSGKITLALDVSISFSKAGKEGDLLIAETRRVSHTRKTGIYLVEVKNQEDELLALFKGTCYVTEKPLF
jgi:acyl-CoA thioesterase